VNGTNHERFDELKDAYVLGALPEQERRELEEYLAAHPERQAEIEELSNVASLLALSPLEQQPAPELRRSIMDVVEAEAQRPPTRTRSWLTGVRELLSVQNLALGAAALLVIGLFSWNMLLQGQVQDLQGQVASLQDSQESRMVALAGTGAAQRAQAEVILLKDHKAVLMAEDMPRVPENKTYQIWVIEGDVPQPSGLFEADGDAVAAVVEKPLDEDDVIAITIEPDGGSQQPTTEPMLTAKL
jgi:anti-sigma-K factor RskA